MLKGILEMKCELKISDRDTNNSWVRLISSNKLFCSVKGSEYRKWLTHCQFLKKVLFIYLLSW